MEGREIRELSDQELVLKERELRESVFRFRMRRGTNQLENSAALKQARRDIARIKTIQAERAREIGRRGD
jgi:large subunit ribosomal protein L29